MESYQRGLSQSFYQFTGSGKPPLAQKDVLNPEAIQYFGFSRKKFFGLLRDVAQCFRAIIEDRKEPKCERVVDGYAGFLFTGKNGTRKWRCIGNTASTNMVKRYNDIYRVQMPNITPHVCRHTYCSNMAKSGMNPKTFQYLMGHSDIGVT